MADVLLCFAWFFLAYLTNITSSRNFTSNSTVTNRRDCFNAWG